FSPMPFWSTIVNGVTLITMGLWAYLSGDSSPMALIPVGFGVGFLALSPGVKTYNKVVAHIVALLAVVTVATLFAPLSMVISQGDSLKVFRVVLMMTTTSVALVFYIRSFIDARKARAAGEV
ncbi:MAG: hypothetical protein AAGA67_04400, partial [Cyanobacteria bacterium P01_F01_bin.153]